MADNSNGVVILISLLNILVYKLQKLQEANQTKLVEAQKSEIQEAEKTNRLPSSVSKLCRQFSLEDIQLATNNFQEELVIGKGGFGNVYKGIIDFGESQVAIKRLKSKSKQGIKEFRSEIELLTKFQHSHIVSLIGYCTDNEEMILVYKFMPQGTLADHLYKRIRKDDASWPSLSLVQRLKICIGAAHGLNYLHTGTGIETRVIHRDVKDTNILLDENFAAKVSDFGLSKKGPANQTCTHVSTNVKGTHGYLDPYYVANRRLTRKSDVYAFGVLLFVVLCGRPALDKSLNEEQINLAEWAQHCFREGLLDQIIDPNIKGKIFSESLKVYVDIAIKCLNYQPKLRPTMVEVVVSLESALTLQEKSTQYSLVEIMPIDCTEDVICSKLEAKDTNHENEYTGKGIIDFFSSRHHKKQSSTTRTFRNREYSGKEIIKFSDGWHRKKQSSATRTFRKREYSGKEIIKFSDGWHHKKQSSATRTFRKREYSGKEIIKFSDGWHRKKHSSARIPIIKRIRGLLSVATRTVSDDNDNVEDISTIGSLKYDFRTVQAATNSFSDSNKLGEGGFGSVYKGAFQNGQEIAVKRLSSGSNQGQQEFINEIIFLAKLQHRNLVRLVGFCFEGTERLLIYEFMPNASLDNFIFDSLKRSYLDWERRYKIISGVARGILYLHEDCRLRIIHRDLKASNVLLDAEMNPKIADFGMARLFNLDETQAITNRIVGTYGYMAPEYAMYGQFSVKSDVFSFGVLVLEILSGQKNHNFRNGENVEDLASFAWKNWREGTPSNLIDPILKSSSGSIHEMIRCIHIGLLCVQENVTDRPTMASVVLMLNSFSLTLAVPSEPAFFMHSTIDKSSTENSVKYSINEVSITDLYPR